ncbi:MAG: hypothetical protein B6D64_11540 [Bacteroidetes bacterium 4484_276]|nr:MAG: hypothetical protein B6D64_11540 [Bacteroidetes bacterium 4484_276]OYT14353.1 MAG: hypothetical protein B6I19_00350 [Bacteroidetes bacterium 4572_114]
MGQSKYKYQIILYLFLLVLSACNFNANKNNKNTRQVRDMLGRGVSIPNNIKNIVALNAGTLRLIVWLDATEFVCAVEGNEKKRQVPYLFAHPELREKPIIGTGNMPEAELLAATAPDVIFATYMTKAEADKLQERTSVPVLAVKYGNFNDEIDTVYNTLRFMGGLLNRTNRAGKIIQYIENTIADLENRTINIDNGNMPEAYIGGVAYRGSHGINSTEPNYPSFNFLNIKNVAGGLKKTMGSNSVNLTNAFIDKEQVIEWDPEFIFLDMAGVHPFNSQILSEAWIGELSAFKAGRVYTVFPYNWYTTNYSTILVNSYFIGKFLYPLEFSDIDPDAKAAEIYHNLLGDNVYPEMVGHYGLARKIPFTK